MTLESELKDKIDRLVQDNQVVLFMKGTKDFPMCGFSARSVQILKALDVDFTDVNILEELDLRAGMKVYSEWPTFPQLYANGEFLGGSDIMMEMYETGELQEALSSSDS